MDSCLTFRKRSNYFKSKKNDGRTETDILNKEEEIPKQTFEIKEAPANTFKHEDWKVFPLKNLTLKAMGVTENGVELELQAILMQMKEFLTNPEKEEACFQHVKLTEKHVQLICNVFRFQNNFKNFSIRDCALNEDFLHLLLAEISKYTRLKKVEYSIQKFDIRSNPGLEGLKVIETLGEILRICSCSALDISECGLSRKHFQELELVLKKTEVTHLSINHILRIGAEEARSIGQLISHTKIESIDLVESGINEESLRAFFAELKRHKIRRINLSHSYDLGTKGFGILAEMIVQCGIKDVILISCSIKSKQMLQLKCAKKTVQRLDLSHNFNFNEGDMKTIGKIVKENRTETLILSRCKLTGNMIGALRKSLSQTKLSNLTLSNNPCIGSDQGMSHLASIASNCELKLLDISRCHLDLDELKLFATQLKGHKLDVLKLNDPRQVVQQEYLDELPSLLSPIVIKEVHLIYWDLGKEANVQLATGFRELNPTLKVITDSENI